MVFVGRGAARVGVYAEKYVVLFHWGGGLKAPNISFLGSGTMDMKNDTVFSYYCVEPVIIVSSEQYYLTHSLGKNCYRSADQNSSLAPAETDFHSGCS